MSGFGRVGEELALLKKGWDRVSRVGIKGRDLGLLKKGWDKR